MPTGADIQQRETQHLIRTYGALTRARDESRRLEIELGREVERARLMRMPATNVARMLDVTDYTVRRWCECYREENPGGPAAGVPSRQLDLAALSPRRRAIVGKHTRLRRIEARIEELEIDAGRQLLRMSDEFGVGGSLMAATLGQSEYEVYRLREKALATPAAQRVPVSVAS